MAVAHEEPEVDAVEAKKLRKVAKRLAKEAELEESREPEVDAVEAKKLRKEAKRLAKEAEIEESRLRKAAKRAAKEAAVAEAAEDDDEGVPVEKALPEAVAEPAAEAEAEPVDEALAATKRLKAEKRARLRANKARAAGFELPEAQTPTKKTKRDAGGECEGAPKAKKSKKTSAEGSSKEVVHKFGDDFKVFVRGLPWSIDEDALRKHFLECGEIEDLKMPKTPAGNSRGVGFIKFETQEGFDAAINLDSSECGGRTMNVAPVEKREGKGQGKEAVSLPKAVSNDLTAFIRGLPFSTTEAVLRKDFEECGAIEKITLPMNSEGKPKGICFIKFLDEAGLAAALKFDNTEYGGRTINVHKAEDGKGGKSKDGKGKGKDGKSKGKDSKGKGKVKDGKGKDSKGASEVPAFEGKKQTFADSDDDE